MLNTRNPANSWSTCATCILYVCSSWFKPSHLFCLDFLQPSRWLFHDFKRHLHPWLRQGPQLKACGWTLAAQLQVHLDWSKKFNGGYFFAQQLPVAKGWRSSNPPQVWSQKNKIASSPKKKWKRGIYLPTEISSSPTPFSKNQKLYQNQCLGDSYWKKGLGDFPEVSKSQRLLRSHHNLHLGHPYGSGPGGHSKRPFRLFTQHEDTRRMSMMSTPSNFMKQILCLC